MKFSIACVQISSQNDMGANIDKAIKLINKAANDGADFIALPENVAFMGSSGEELLANSYLPLEHPALLAFQETAVFLQKWILVGSLAVKVEGSDKLANRSFLINDKGVLVANYDKIHLYEASVKDGETHNESHRYEAGENAVLVETPWGKLGMTICYDLRFPHLYRTLAQEGAIFMTVPSAFTKYTGEAHWHTLLQARAIENGCYIIAPAQTGSHPADRSTYGHSLIVDPWGNVVSDAGSEEGIVIADVDVDLVAQVREQLPSLEHDREFGGMLFE